MAQNRQMSIKEMMELKVKLEHDQEVKQSWEQREKMPLQEMGEMVMQAGQKHRGHTFRQIYEDDSYNKWVAAQCCEEGGKHPGVNAYAHYLRRRLQADLAPALAESDQRPLMPKISSTKKDMPADSSQGSVLEPWMAQPVPPYEEDDAMTQWSKVEVMETEMSEMHQRLAKMEDVMGQVLRHLQENIVKKE